MLLICREVLANQKHRLLAFRILNGVRNFIY